ncbi:preprotein translocase subunit SecE [Cyanobium sp. HWJ4-Hawea]|uniref:preprotein translocase subunit SecE n=1 Tax=Cyanobium sp. HWJ4-Hawea TaxID=2823713 RepID=UPI0020CD984E|nr:preprotein translocase subunit SecE [Cyanobium sp. HWJ4-Hawea]MCP9808157.1 preprotein translocase subunit SecE [Cyanobium sp. HWJ4-Hawea]
MDTELPSGPAPDAPSPEQPAAPPVNRPEGFVAATLAELRKVVWPSRQQLFSESVAVILMVSLSAAAIAAVDRFYSWGSTQVFR